MMVNRVKLGLMRAKEAVAKIKMRTLARSSLRLATRSGPSAPRFRGFAARCLLIRKCQLDLSAEEAAYYS